MIGLSHHHRMLLGAEAATFATALQMATELAGEGRAAIGYLLLLEGRHHASTVQLAGEHWGDELLLAWQEVIDGYAARYSVGRA